MLNKPLTLEELAGLPAVQFALAEKEKAEEAQALNARLECLEQHREAVAELDDLAAEYGELVLAQEELERQKIALDDRWHAHRVASQKAATRKCALAKSLHREHGGRLIADLVAALGARIRNAEEARAFQLSLKSRHANKWGEVETRDDEAAKARAAELERDLESLRRALANIQALTLTPVSPHEIARRAQAEIEACGLKLSSTEEQSTGWRFVKWEAARPAKT